MSTHATLNRYICLLEKVISNRPPSFEELYTHLADAGHDISKRTLQRDLEYIRTEFGVEIIYDRARNAYKLASDNELLNETILRFTSLLNTAQLLSENLKNDEELLECVLFEHQGSMRGTQHLRILMHAIKARSRVSFAHENYHTGVTKKYSVNPYLLKEYQGRWYLVAMVENVSEFRTFGLDRISDLQILKTKFRRQASPDPRGFFEDVIGLVYSESETQEVRILVDALQVKYLAALPLHRSQVIVPVENDEYMVTLRVKPNYELLQRILMLGEHAEVISPPSVRKEIKDLIKTMSKYYKK